MEDRSRNLPILLLAFCRPNLTAKAIENALSIGKSSKVYVSQDGPIRGFYEEEYRETQKQIILMQKENPNIELILRETNQGITSHVIGSLGKVLEKYPATVMLEEDMVLSSEGYQFLNELNKVKEPELRIAYNSTGHVSLNSTPRVTRFPEQWGISMNRSMFDSFSETVRESNVEWKIVSKVMQELEISRTKKLASAIYWFRLFRIEMSQPHGWDASLQYAAWRANARVLVAPKSEVLDVASNGDPGGVTKRNQSIVFENTHTASPERKDSRYCKICEIHDLNKRKITLLGVLRELLQLRSRTKRAIRIFIIRYIGLSPLTEKFLR